MLPTRAFQNYNSLHRQTFDLLSYILKIESVLDLCVTNLHSKQRLLIVWYFRAVVASNLELTDCDGNEWPGNGSQSIIRAMGGLVMSTL